MSEDVIELLIYHQPSVKPSLTLRPFGVLGYVAGHSLTMECPEEVDQISKRSRQVVGCHIPHLDSGAYQLKAH